MSAALGAELFKQRTTRTAAGLFATMIVLVLFVVALHGSGATAGLVDSSTEQLFIVFGWGQYLGALFAALLGAMSITGEIRHGTIRPTLLVTPDRRRVVAAKVCVSMLIATGFGLGAAAVAVGAGTAVLHARGLEVLLDAGDHALLIAGSAVAAALWAAIGVGVGAVVRNQVAALVAITVWLLFVEQLLVGDLAGIGDIASLLPGSAGRAISGQNPDVLLPPGAALVLLALYAATAALVGARTTSRRDTA
jgi:ABC-type transport system involved in multi-copper enzyme maturation permease subunit